MALWGEPGSSDQQLHRLRTSLWRPKHWRKGHVLRPASLQDVGAYLGNTHSLQKVSSLSSSIQVLFWFFNRKQFWWHIFKCISLLSTPCGRTGTSLTDAQGYSKWSPKAKSTYVSMGRRDISIPSVEVILSCGKENKRSYDITVFGDTENSTAYCPEPTLKLALLWEEDWTRWQPEVPSRLAWICDSRIAWKLL